MRSVYFHLVGGASGDMLLSSLIEAGYPFRYLVKELKKLKIKFNVAQKTSSHSGSKKISFEGQGPGSYRKLVRLVKASRLDSDIKDKVLETYGVIFDTERKIHNIKGRDFRFHHLGDIDAIAEISGFYLALRYLGIEKIYVSNFPCDLLAPATLEFLKGKKIYPVHYGYETVTPTAAALLRDAEQKAFPLSFEKSGTGYGDNGQKDCLIAYIINTSAQSSAQRSGAVRSLPFRGSPKGTANGQQIEQDKIIKIETNIDDMNPQIFASLFDALYQAMAKEVYIEQVVMKKTRPAFVLNVLCLPGDFEKIRGIIFSHTSTFGIRYQEYQRDKLKDEFIYKNTKLGKVKFRVSQTPLKKQTAEYQDCLALSKKLKVPLIEVYRRM